MTDQVQAGIAGLDLSEAGPTVVCRECGSHEKPTYIESTKQKMLELSLCFSCLFWTEHWENYQKGDECSFVIHGEHYHVGSEKESRNLFRGFGGAQFIIDAFDGRRVITTNLWHQGVIPKHFRKRFPDNARFMERTRPMGGTYANPTKGAG